MKYLENRRFKLRYVFTFEILASRPLKLDLMLISFEIFFPYFKYYYDYTRCVYLIVLVLELISTYIFSVLVQFFPYSVIVVAHVRYCTHTFVLVLVHVRDCTYLPVLACVCDYTSVPVLGHVHDCTFIHVLVRVRDCTYVLLLVGVRDYTNCICWCARLYLCTCTCSLARLYLYLLVCATLFL
jgi:hypothetical protein